MGFHEIPLFPFGGIMAGGNLSTIFFFSYPVLLEHKLLKLM